MFKAQSDQVGTWTLTIVASDKCGGVANKQITIEYQQEEPVIVIATP